MKKNLAAAINAIALVAVLAMPIHLPAQEQAAMPENRNHHHRYKLVDMGTFGGPQSYVPDGGDITAVTVLNNQGMFTGSADTSTLDPFPDFCFNEDCFVSHAFQSRSRHKADLGVLPGGASSAPTWISENGLISGLSENGELDPLIPGLPEVRAVLWQNGGIADLGTLEGGYESVSNAVNSRGQVAGASTNTVPDSNSMVGLGYQVRAFFWRDGVMQDLGTLGTGTDAQAALINERGQVVGWSYTGSDPSDICAGVYGFPLSTGSFLWEEGKGMLNLGGLGGSCTVATGLNDRGQVVGQSWLTDDLTGHAFRWDHNHGLIDLGTLGGDFSSAHAINNNGLAVGGSYLSDGLRIDATLWKGRAAVDLGTVDADTCSYALSINGLGQVVGISGATNCESTRAFLWEHGGPMVDLNALVSSNSGIYVPFAFTINDLGEIAGLGVLPNGDEHAVLLIPCDGNHPGIEGCDYSPVDAAEATRESSAAPQIHVPIHRSRNMRRVPRPRLGPMSHIALPITGSVDNLATPISRDSDWRLEDKIAIYDRAEPAADSSSKASCDAAQAPQSCIPVGRPCYGPGPTHCCPAPFPHHSFCSSRTGWGTCYMN